MVSARSLLTTCDRVNMRFYRLNLVFYVKQPQLNIKIKASNIDRKFLLRALSCVSTCPETLLLIRDSQSHLKWLCKRSSAR